MDSFKKLEEFKDLHTSILEQIKKPIVIESGEKCQTSGDVTIFISFKELKKMRFVVQDKSENKHFETLKKSDRGPVSLVHEMAHALLRQNDSILCEILKSMPADFPRFPHMNEQWVILGDEDSPIGFCENTIRRKMGINLRMTHYSSAFVEDKINPFELHASRQVMRIHDAAFAGVNKDLEAMIENSKKSKKEKEIDVPDCNGRTPLHHAAGSDLKSLELLLSAGADIHKRDFEGRTALHYAAQVKDLKLMKFLLEKGAEANVKDANGLTPLILAALANTDKNVEVLLKTGEFSQAEIVFAFFVAVRKSNRKAAGVFLENGLDVNIQDKEGRTALHYCQDPLLVKFLIRKGAKIDVRDNSGLTALHIAAKEANIDLVKALSSFGALELDELPDSGFVLDIINV
ncbi:MAG: hypothetical protein Tsb0015_01940 [Simkaniaceae bacterium]